MFCLCVCQGNYRYVSVPEIQYCVPVDLCLLELGFELLYVGPELSLLLLTQLIGLQKYKLISIATNTYTNRT